MPCCFNQTSEATVIEDIDHESDVAFLLRIWTNRLRLEVIAAISKLSFMYKMWNP